MLCVDHKWCANATSWIALGAGWFDWPSNRFLIGFHLYSLLQGTQKWLRVLCILMPWSLWLIFFFWTNYVYMKHLCPAEVQRWLCVHYLQHYTLFTNHLLSVMCTKKWIQGNDSAVWKPISHTNDSLEKTFSGTEAQLKSTICYLLAGNSSVNFFQSQSDYYFQLFWLTLCSTFFFHIYFSHTLLF